MRGEGGSVTVAAVAKRSPRQTSYPLSIDPLKSQPLCRSSAVCVGGLETVEMGCGLSASRFWAVATPETTGASKGCRTAEYESIRDGVDGSLSPKLSTSTIEPVVAIGAWLDHDLIQGLIEADKHLIPVAHQNHLAFCGLLPLLPMPSYG